MTYKLQKIEICGLPDKPITISSDKFSPEMVEALKRMHKTAFPDPIHTIESVRHLIFSNVNKPTQFYTIYVHPAGSWYIETSLTEEQFMEKVKKYL